jgi:ectoine hydroxylase-related dioxygenase (phytanoyl-CoA dioxygenase family)
MEAISAYERDGYFLYHDQVFAPDRLARLTELFEEHAAALGSGQRTDELDVPHFKDPRLLEFLFADEVLDVVQPFIGSNIGLWSSHFISKEPHVGRATPWHEDSSYWNGRADTMTGIITVWLALDRATEENGCMRVIPGSHLDGGFSDYERVDRATNLFSSQIKPEQIDESRAVAFELERGECSLHDARLIHGARPNTSALRRCGYTMRYFNTAIHFYPEKNTHHKLWLARGKDLGNNRYEN